MGLLKIGSALFTMGCLQQPDGSFSPAFEDAAFEDDASNAKTTRAMGRASPVGEDLYQSP
jgi:hypothetical protein